MIGLISGKRSADVGWVASSDYKCGRLRQFQFIYNAFKKKSLVVDVVKHQWKWKRWVLCLSGTLTGSTYVTDTGRWHYTNLFVDLPNAIWKALCYIQAMFHWTCDITHLWIYCCDSEVQSSKKLCFLRITTEKLTNSSFFQHCITSCKFFIFLTFCKSGFWPWYPYSLWMRMYVT